MKIRLQSSVSGNQPFLRVIAGCLISLMLSSVSVSARGTSGYVSTQFAPGDFKLVQGDSAADIYVGMEENWAVLRCANDLAADMQRVTGKLPSVKRTTTGLSANAVIVGTVDTSTVIKALVTAGKIDVSQIQGKSLASHRRQKPGVILRFPEGFEGAAPVRR
jgi:hypothetical protein